MIHQIQKNWDGSFSESPVQLCLALWIVPAPRYNEGNHGIF